MRDRLVGLLDRADSVIASCAGVVSDDALAPLIESVRNARIRLAYPTEVLVVALAGGTGSGKSSLLNAMVGEDVAEVGGVRPTTSHPEAAVPASISAAMGGYLDRIGVTVRHDSPLDDLCLIDLPDIDSLALSHHHRVDQLLPKVDLVVWVTDPEKYKDARLHDDYLRPMATSAAQFLFVLNQSDRLSTGQVDQVLEDLARAVEDDGIDAPTILATAADPAIGGASGIEELLAKIEEKRSSRDTLYGKVLNDLHEAALVLEPQSKLRSDYDARAELVRDSAAETLAIGELGQATSDVVGFLTDLSVEAGGDTGASLRRLAGDAPQHLVRIEGSVPRVGGRRSRWRKKSPVVPTPADYQAGLDEAIFRPARALLAQQAISLESVAELGAEVESLRNETRS